LEVLPFGPRGAGLTLTTDNGTQFTSARYVETLNQLGITHRRTAYNHPEGNSYIVRFHRSLKEEEVWLNEYQNFDQAELSIASWIEEYNHDRPHRRLRGRTSHESRAQFLAQTRKRRLCTVEALCLGCPSFRGISAIVSFRLPKSRLLVRRESGLAHNFRVARDSGRIGPILPKGAHKQN
jgi:Integrase core domain